MTDPITTEIIKSALVYASEEMGIAVRNSAYSPNIKERLDHSCALFDRFGRLIAQAEHIPVHLGSLPWGLQRMLEIVEREHGGVREGEMWVANDPYVTGTHLNDVTLVRPIFYGGSLVGYAANKAHHADVGGSAPGSMPADARDLFAEGSIVPPLRLVARRSRRRRDGRALPRELAHARGAQRRPARADRRQLHRRAPLAASCANATASKRLEAAIERALDDSERACARRCARSATASSRRRDYLEDRDGDPRIVIALRLELRDGERALRLRGHVAATRLSAQRGLRRHALGRALRVARGHRSDDSDERRLLSAGRGARAARARCSIRAGRRPSRAATSRRACATPTSCCKRSRRRRRSAFRRAAAAR